MTIEATSIPIAVKEGLNMTRNGGRYVIVGHYTNTGEIIINPHLEINLKHIDIRFASIEECHKLALAIEKVGFDFYINVKPPIGRIGITQFEYRNRNKSGYFDGVRKATETYNKVTYLSFDPLKRLATILRQNVSSKVQIAYENEGYGYYFAGLIRHINIALLHLDFAGLDAPDWTIGNITSQLVWNVYIKAPSQGGICKVYNCQWQPEDEKYKIPGSYGYDSSLVANSEVKHNIPLTGDLVIFNSRNFHEVLPGIGERITISSFIGKMREEI